MDFFQLGLSPEVVKSVTEAGYQTPTPIQAQAIPSVLAGRDVLGCAQTGTGKTASFVLPLIDILAEGRSRARMPRALILEPTRELATQVSENFEKYGKYSHLSMALIIGGVSMGDQEKLLDRGVDVLIATPGRLLDHFERGRILLTDTKILVIDEADRMLDMGFIPDIEKLVNILPPRGRQTLFFSATLSPEIKILADKFLDNPKEITVSPSATTATTVAQHLIIASERQKREKLRALLRSENVKNAIIFCNRKITVTTLLQSLRRHGFSVAALHGDMQQSARTATLDSFRNNEIPLLVASDVAARGLDISDLSHVINFDVPMNAEDYVHRIGRTGRAGRSGRAFTFATPQNSREVAAIEALIGQPIPRFTPLGENLVEFETGATATQEGAELSADSGNRTNPNAQATKGRKPRRMAGSGRRRRGEPAPESDAVSASADPQVGGQPEGAENNIADAFAEAGNQGDLPLLNDAVDAVDAGQITPEASASDEAAPPRGSRSRDRYGRRDNRENREPGQVRGNRPPRPERERPERGEHSETRDTGRQQSRDSGRDSGRQSGQYAPRNEVPVDFVYGAADSPFGEFGPVPAFLLQKVKIPSFDAISDDAAGE
ncbi:MAG: DEAD/DEAH box helicase [Alphaproteobacteria bacterium]|nr:DEAD/DEAH box helicase [Alphaproteobacteria bacterium]